MKCYVEIIRNRKRISFEIKEDVFSVKQGFENQTIKEIVEGIIVNSLKFFNYSIDIGSESDSKSLKLQLIDTCAETDSIKDLEPVIKTIHSACKTFKIKVGQIVF